MSWSGPYTYSWTPATRPARISTSRTEILNIAAAYAVLTGCLTLVLSGYTFIGRALNPGGAQVPIWVALVVGAVAALTGFLLHEMAHKVAAQRRGFWAEFRASVNGLALAVFTTMVGFIFAAPGATLVGGIPEYDLESWGRTGLAGPMSNGAFAVAFYAGALATFSFNAVIGGWLVFLAFINAWFGTFNLIPFGPLDGRKVLRWSRGVWAAAIAGTVAATAVCYAAITVGTPFLGL